MDSKTAGDLCMALLIGEEDPKQLAAQAIAQSVYVQANRNGFMRYVLARQELEAGEIPMARVKKGNVRFAVSAVRGEDLDCKDNLFTPPEFILQARPAAHKSGGFGRFGDLMAHAEEAMYVAEDRLLCLMLQPNMDIVLNESNPSKTLDALLDAATFNPTTLAVGTHVYNRLISDSEFISRMEPVSKYEEIMAGRLCRLKSKDGTKEVTVVSDAYRHPAHRVFDHNTLVLMGSPLELGQYTDRGSYRGETNIKKNGDEVESVGVYILAMISMVINPACYLRAKEQ